MNQTTELPQLASCVYTSSISNLGDFGTLIGGQTLEGYTPTQNFSFSRPEPESIMPTPNQTSRRVVQIFIADANENIPLEKSLLFQDEKPHLTDLTDQELFFEINIKAILDRHNEYRVTMKDKEDSTKDNPVFLEKAKIRDLKMTVVTVASF